MIEVSKLTKNFGKTHVLKGVSFALNSGDQCVIQGSSGSGKSTLLHLIAGLDQADSGQILMNGTNLKQLDDTLLAKYRNEHVGLVFQFHFLLPSMNCLDNILLPGRIGQRITDQVKSRVKHLAKELGVKHCLKKYPYQLSGGEQQRVNIIRALSLAPEFLLCDEPTGNLDSKNTQKVTTLLRELATEFNSTLLVVTHDKEVADHFEQELHMEDGLLV